MKLAFCSDIHLNFLQSTVQIEFYKQLQNHDSDAVVIAGDIAEGHSLEDCLRQLRLCVSKPIYYVHGNHDFYWSSFQDVEEISTKLTEEFEELHWLQCKGPIKLTDDVCIIGHDGWYDATLGVYENGFELQDFSAIRDFASFSRTYLKVIFARLAQEAGMFLENALDEAFGNYNYKKAIVVTHVPPFTDLAKFNGKPTQPYALPFFVSKIIGDSIQKAAFKYRSKEILVLCGHTHDKASFSFENISGICAGAVYGKPQIYSTIEV